MRTRLYAVGSRRPVLCSPVCRVLQGLNTGTRERVQVRPQAMLEAKDLPANNLSKLLEQRVIAAVTADRQARAAMQVGWSGC